MTDEEFFQLVVGDCGDDGLVAIVEALQRAYRRCDAHVAMHPEFSGPMLKQARGMLMPYFAWLELREVLEKHREFFVVHWDANSRNTARHLVIETASMRFTVSQLHSPREFPRFADFRQSARMKNQSTFDFVIDDGYDVDLAKINVFLIHGWETLNFIQLVVPHPTQNRYTHSFDVLRHAAKVAAPADVPADENVEPSKIAEVPDLAHPVLKKGVTGDNKEEGNSEDVG